MSSPVKFIFSHLSRWREYAEAIKLAVKELDESAEVYVIGSVASGKYTVRSDIDILIVVKRDLKGRERRTFKVRVFELAFDKYNLPFGAPVELHVVNPTEAKKYLDKPFVKIT